jgi:nitrite reductase/ring-hydroxylating ferredoxin subunit
MTTTRRAFLLGAAGAILGAAGCGGDDEDDRPRPPAGFRRAARLDELTTDTLTGVPLRPASYTPVDQPFAFLRRTGATAVAFEPACTYGRCRLRYSEGNAALLCACHGCVYDAQGDPRSGPAREPLRRLPTRVVDGVVYVRT